jgi:hypothetical protein
MSAQKLKLKSVPEAVVVREPSYGEFLEAIAHHGDAPMDACFWYGLIIGKDAAFVKKLPLLDGIAVELACKPLFSEVQRIMGALVGQDDTKDA